MFSYINGFRLCYSFALIQTEKLQNVAYLFHQKICYLIKLGFFCLTCSRTLERCSNSVETGNSFSQDKPTKIYKYNQTM